MTSEVVVSKRQSRPMLATGAEHHLRVLPPGGGKEAEDSPVNIEGSQDPCAVDADALPEPEDSEGFEALGAFEVEADARVTRGEVQVRDAPRREERGQRLRVAWAVQLKIYNSRTKRTYFSGYLPICIYLSFFADSFL